MANPDLNLNDDASGWGTDPRPYTWRQLGFVAAAIGAALWLMACSNSPTAPAPVQTPAPAPQPIAACVSQNTADVTLVNASPTSLTYDVVLDGVNRGTLGPGQSKTFTVTAGTPHTVISRFTNTAVDACSSTPSFVQCTTQTLTCRA